MKKSELREIVKEVIRKVGDEYAVYPKKGGKRLGTHNTRSGAEKQLTAIHLNKEGAGGADTHWIGADNEKITLQDILDLTKNIKVINYPTQKLAKTVLNWDNNPEEIERISQVVVSSQYPILIMVDEQNKIQWILDGNHRAQKALRSKAKTIPAKLIRPSDLNDKAKKILLEVREVPIHINKEVVTPADPSKVNPKELKMGIEAEMEHTEDSQEAKIIALQHLAEDPKYYTKLASLNLENIDEPMNPGILKKRLGKLSCTKVRAERAKLKDKGTTYAKALQRYLNYHCQ